jgi:hypothetical protein
MDPKLFLATFEKICTLGPSHVLALLSAYQMWLGALLSAYQMWALLLILNMMNKIP